MPVKQKLSSPTSAQIVGDEFKLTINDKDVIFEKVHCSILECAEACDVEIHYHCRDGYCGACRTTLVKGSISYPNGEPLAYIGPDEILPCCCIPTSDLVLRTE